jgi:DNA-binding NarL/FixJ family response regulator
VVILDLGMSGGHFEPVSSVGSLLQDYPKIRILVLTGNDDEVYNRQVGRSSPSAPLQTLWLAFSGQP